MELAIDTSDMKVVRVTLKKKGTVVGQLEEGNQYGSQVLLPLIQRLLKKRKLKLSELTSVDINPGPGSFTGLRVGVAVAQALGFALNIPVNGKIGKPVELKY